MHVRNLGLADFRSWQSAELDLGPGVTVLVGPNGQGKTNLLEALGYLATLGSHRVSADADLVRQGSRRAWLRATVVHAGRELTVELEIAPGHPNRARINRSPVPRPREVLGVLRTVLFAPEDLALVRGDPGGRRRFLDELLVTRAPRLAGVRSDYDRVLRQRAALLKSAGAARRAGRLSTELATLDVWDGHLARAGAQLVAARRELLGALDSHVTAGYAGVAGAGADTRSVGLSYRSSVDDTEAADTAGIEHAMLAALGRVRDEELDRGVCLVGPHRDDLDIALDGTVARNFASQGESWSLALALRLGSYQLLRAEGAEPVLLLDDVFAELDRHRRARLARVAAAAEQVLLTAAVEEDVPAELDGARVAVQSGQARRVE